MMEHSKRSEDEVFEEDALKMKERKRDLWKKMMNIMILKSELKCTTATVSYTHLTLPTIYSV